MELTTDVSLRGTAWNRAIDTLAPIFKTRTNYSLYMLALTIGVMYDRRIEKPEENGEDIRNVPVTYFKTTTTANWTLSSRLPSYQPPRSSFPRRNGWI